MRFAGIGSRNGRIMPAAELCVPIEDRGFLLGDAVYETLRTYEGRLFALAEHLDRLLASLAAVRIVDHAPRDALSEQLVAVADHAYRALRALPGHGDDELVVRMTVTRGPGPHGFSPKGAGPAQVYVLARALPPTPTVVAEEGLRVVTSRVRRVAKEAQDPAIKAGSALNLVLARLEADAAGADEALLTDAAGRYLEASGANLFALVGGTFWTPGPHDGILGGVTMRRVVGLLESMGFTAHRAPIPKEVLLAADEVFLTQTTREVVPVVRVDDTSIGGGVPGRRTAEVHAAFRKEVQAWLRTR